ncbi:MAG: 1-deoxy-D-xylulose-5-phosphate reductoisomerase [Candidatus Izemoplasmatales bacterium]
MRNLDLLGATGSIGRQTIDVVAAEPDRFRIRALGADRDVEGMTELVRRLSPDYVAMNDETAAATIAARFPDVEVGSGRAGLIRLSSLCPDDGDGLFVNAAVGVAGLEPTIAALRIGRSVALANKETLVVGGELVMALAREKHARILPIDSEHSALWQCLEGEDPESVLRLLITASGGAFRDKARADLDRVSVADALAHPNWKMGKKITIDSATMMNKGFEVIEAMHLFSLPLGKIDTILHRESYVHSLVEFVDGSMMAQVSSHDMRLPISYALHYPDRVPNPTERLDLAKVGKLTFAPVDLERYPCLALAYAAARRGGNAPAALNAANEVAVALFLEGVIPFLAIEEIVARSLEELAFIEKPTLADLLSTDEATRRSVRMRHARPLL